MPLYSLGSPANPRAVLPRLQDSARRGGLSPLGRRISDAVRLSAADGAQPLRADHQRPVGHQSTVLVSGEREADHTNDLSAISRLCW